jgi:hypothetical protein
VSLLDVFGRIHRQVEQKIAFDVSVPHPITVVLVNSPKCIASLSYAKYILLSSGSGQRSKRARSYLLRTDFLT